MKIGIFADIHGNIYAFEKIWEELKKESCDLCVFAGDICGYYYYQNEIIEKLRSIKELVAVIGNHDSLFLKILNDEGLEVQYSAKYGKSLSFLKQNITAENLRFLKKLPNKVMLRENNIGIFHGSPWKPLDEYIYSDSLLDKFEELPYKIVILGHTHIPMNKTVGHLRIINPGSVGQPRDYRDASFAVFNTATDDVLFKRVRYDTETLIKDIRARNETSPYLIEVLKREKNYAVQ